MTHLLKSSAIAGVLCFALLTSCTKSAIVKPTPSEDVADKTAKATTPTGTVVYTSNGYTLTFINNEPTFDDATRQKFVNTFFTVYPKLLNRFFTGASKQVTFIIDPNYDGVAATGGGRVTYNPDWFRDRPEDIDVVTHEVMHVVQAYTGGAPGWLTEGIADYARYKYGVNNAAAGWGLPAFSSSQKYTDAYGVTARFLVWLERRVRSSIVDDMNTALRNKTYTSNTWVQLTGKTTDQLWADYSRNPAL